MGVVTSTVAALIGAAVIGGGATALATGAFKKPREPEARAAAPGVSAESLIKKSKVSAAEEVKRKRRMQLRTGGRTLLADGSAISSGPEKTLLGE